MKKKQRQQDAMVAEMERRENEYNQFVAKLNASEITDVSPYLSLEVDSRYRSKFISCKMFVDECIAFANENDDAHVILTAIEYGYGKQHYAKWAHHPNQYIRIELAAQGYFPDLFIKDEVSDVRTNVLNEHPQYAKYLLDAQSFNELSAVTWAYRDMYEPDFDELAELLANPYLAQETQFRSIRDELQNKFETRDIPLSTIEKTMTVTQLFMTNSEGWKRVVSSIQLRELTKCEDQLRAHPNCEELFTTYIQSDEIYLEEFLKMHDCQIRTT